jgi:DNA-binding NarL/FixJ family response regulator
MVAERMEGVEIVGYASDGEQALRLCEDLKPDVLVVHLRIPKLDATLLIEALAARNLSTRVVVYTATANATLLKTVHSANPAALFHKDDSLEDLRSAIRSAATGSFFVSPTVAGALRNSRSSDLPLSPRELAIAKLLADGKQNKEVSALLGVSDKTVRSHREHIYGKLHVKDIAGLVNWMSRANLEN